MPRQTPNRTSTPATETGSDSTSSDIMSLFNTTLSLHRISPLFIGTEYLTPARLQHFAGRLRDTLVGDVVRGVEVGLDGSDAAMGNAGALEDVLFDWINVDSVVSTEQRALQLSLQYENALSIALLLPSREDAAAPAKSSFVHLPLLLLRMPTPLKAVVMEFLSSTFDCRVGPLRLGNNDLINGLEGWIQEAGLPTSGVLAKDAVLTLGFRLPKPKKPLVPVGEAAEVDGADGSGIKSIDIIIPSHDLRRFHRAGRTVNGGDAHRPFFTAVALYIKHHLALDMSHPNVRITRIAFGGFVLSENRLKLFAAPDGTVTTSTQRAAVQQLVENLVERAKGSMPAP